MPAPTTLVAIAQPQTTIAGATILPVTFQFQYAAGTGTSMFVPVTVRLASNTGAQLHGSLTQWSSFGRATFSDLSVTNADKGYRIVASGGGLMGSSSAFDITPAPPAQIVFDIPPVNTFAGSTFATPIRVVTADSYG